MHICNWGFAEGIASGRIFNLTHDLGVSCGRGYWAETDYTLRGIPKTTVDDSKGDGFVRKAIPRRR